VKFRSQVSGQWVNLIHALAIAPLLIYIGANKKETPIKIHEISRIKNRLRLWVRIFENLYFYHSKGIIHGNIKPQNILIRDRASVDIKQTYESDFFEKKEEVPHVVLLDGGYFHFIPHHEEIENT
jgi:serine/threonine protein kinase